MVVPASSYVLNGITLKCVMHIMAKKGFSVTRASMDLETFCALPYMFVTNALMGMVPVRRIDHTTLDMDNLLCRQVNKILFSTC
ncbi:aminotransferase class IV [Desulfobacter sp.]